MYKVDFKLVDQGCLMFESEGGRWIIEHPFEGHLPTASKQWDVIVEHPENPHKEPLKFLGSFRTKDIAIRFVKKIREQGGNYFSLSATQSQFYNEDYTHK
jgi:hypothetical protein